jgi:hypothetical protein
MIHDGGHTVVVRKDQRVTASAVTAWRRTRDGMAERPSPRLSRRHATPRKG